MDLLQLARNHTMGMYFSNTFQADDNSTDWPAAYELLKQCVEEGIESPLLQLWYPFENFTYEEILELVDTDTDVLYELLKDVQDAAGVPV